MVFKYKKIIVDGNSYQVFLDSTTDEFVVKIMSLTIRAESMKELYSSMDSIRFCDHNYDTVFIEEYEVLI